MAYKEKRKLIKVGSSRCVVLPKPWLDFHGSNAKVLTLIGDAILIIAPKGYEKKAQALMDVAER